MVHPSDKYVSIRCLISKVREDAVQLLDGLQYFVTTAVYLDRDIHH